MKIVQTLSATRLSNLIAVPRLSEQSHAQVERASDGGIFIGCTERSRMPFFMNPELAINPHLFIVGMSGGGKTYLAKNLMIKLYAVLSCQVVLIDFTGEYEEFASFVGCTYCRDLNLQHILGMERQELVYLNLGNMKEQEKIANGRRVIAELTSIMRMRGLNNSTRLFIVLDEAWKLLRSDPGLETILREGRKYRTGLVLASQLIEDMERELCSNVATFFAFRVQDAGSLARLKQNYELDDAQILRIQNLDVGSCCVVQTYKSGRRGVFTISRVAGLSVKEMFALTTGEAMVEIEFERVERMVRALARKEPGAVVAKIHAERGIDLSVLVEELLRLGADRVRVLAALRELGLDDTTLADAFAYAVAKVKKDEE